MQTLPVHTPEYLPNQLLANKVNRRSKWCALALCFELQYFSTSKSVSTIHCMDNDILYSYLIYFFLKLQLPQKHSSTGYDKTYNINYSWKWFQPMVKQYLTSQSSVSMWSNLIYLILDMIILYTIKCPSDQQYLRLYLKDHTEVTRK